MIDKDNIRSFYSVDQLASLPDLPTVLMAASVPYIRKYPDSMPNGERRRKIQSDRKYVSSAHPESIRMAVMELALGVLRRGGRLVFGGHPAISPMVLHAARDLNLPDGRVLVFQSDYFKSDITEPTLRLSNWNSGVMIMTPDVRNQRDSSLTCMREFMCAVPSLKGAVFIGGMDGIVEESRLFHARNPTLSRYALASTGGAALLDLFDSQHAPQHAGQLDRNLLKARNPSMALLIQYILNDMNFSPLPAAG